jgi:hypothetical protein
MVSTSVNAGRGIINYCGHGGTTYWSTTGFNNSDVNALTNDDILPFIFDVACLNGNFGETTCFAEAWVRATNGSEPTGAIGIYASSINQPWTPPMEAQDEFNSLYVADSYNAYGAYCYAAACSMMDDYPGDGETYGNGHATFNTWHIFGDPTLRITGNVPIPCERDYTMEVVDFSWEDISSTGTDLDLGDLDYKYVTIPFDFTFYCNSYNMVSIGSKGVIYFVNDYLGLTNVCIPGINNYGIHTFIAAFWDDLNPGAAGAVYYEVRGTAPNRRLIIQWHGVPHYYNVGLITFQAILYEGNNNIRLQYFDTDFGNASYDYGASATVGVQGSTDKGTQYSCNDPSVTGGLSLLFTPSSMEQGQATIDHEWKAVTLSDTYQDPVLILAPPTYHGADPGVVRLQNITESSFDIRFQEWLYKDGTHTQENIPYLALSSGRHNMPDGSIWEADTFSLSGTGAWTSQSFNSSFPSTPALFLTAQTYNGWHPITVRARDVTNTGFEAALFEEENKMDGHVTEEIGYLAVYSPQLSGTVNINGMDVPYLLQAQSVDHRFVPVLSSNIKLEEEQSKDSEVNHIDETISILALGDKIFTQDISSDGGDTAAIRRLAPEYGAAMEWGTVDGVDHNWIKIPLAKEYLNPVVVAKPVSSLGGDPGVIRVRNVSHNSFELRYNEWLYKDGWHIQERVFYLVVEAGIRSVAGLTVEAGRLNSSKLLADGWESINFSASFGQTPGIFTSVQTYNGADPVTTRLSNCTFAGFDLTMDEEEAKNDGHITETIGWVAIERGTGSTADNRSVVVLSGSTSHVPTQINFGQSMDRRFPVLVSDMITTYGVDPGFLRYQNLGPGSIDLFIQEEASSDPEMNHVVENVSVFVGE